MHSSVFPNLVVVLAQGCHVGIIALSGSVDHLLYSDPLVDYDLRYDLMSSPSGAMLEAVHFMHKAAYTHVIIQQVRCAAPHMGGPQYPSLQDAAPNLHLHFCLLEIAQLACI